MPVVEVYGKYEAKDTAVQGGIVAFNLLRSDGSHIGYYGVSGGRESRRRSKQTRRRRTSTFGRGVTAIRERAGSTCDSQTGCIRRCCGRGVACRLAHMKDSCSDAFDQYNGVPLGAGEDGRVE